MLTDPLWTNIPAVEEGDVHESNKDHSSWLYPGAIANTQTIDDVVNSLVQE
jgi:iron complex transport system substrate-binding protein